MSAFLKPVEVTNQGTYRPTPTNARFDSLMLPYNEQAERRWTRDTIGKTFLDALKAARTPNTINYNTFLGPIQPAFADADLENLFLNEGLYQLMAISSVFEALPYIHFQVTSQGVQVNNTEFSTPGTGSDMRYVRDQMTNTLQFWQKEIVTFLCENQDIYIPLGFDPEGICATCHNNGQEGKRNNGFFMVY